MQYKLPPPSASASPSHHLMPFFLTNRKLHITSSNFQVKMTTQVDPIYFVSVTTTPDLTKAIIADLKTVCSITTSF